MGNETADVVIVGAGPTGLMLAIEVVLGGATAIVLDRLAEPDETIKAGAIGALGAEALERRGIGPAMEAEERAMTDAMAAMMKSSGITTGPPPWKKIGGHFAGSFLIDQTRQREPERRLRGVRQQALERMLGERALEVGIEIKRGWEVTDFSEHPTGITVEGRNSSEAFCLYCAFLAGCDGGRSMIRKRAGFDFPGTEPTLTGHQAIVELDIQSVYYLSAGAEQQRVCSRMARGLAVCLRRSSMGLRRIATHPLRSKRCNAVCATSVGRT